MGSTPSADRRYEQSIGFLLHDVARLLRKRFEQRARAADLGLTRAQWQVLANLARREGVNQATLAQHLELEPITLVRILDRLEDQRLVERRADPHDRRAHNLFLTAAARPLLEQIWTVGTAVRADALAGIPPEDQEQLMRILRRMKANIVGRLAEPEPAAEPARRAHG